MRKYKKVSIPIEAYENFKVKNASMNTTLKELGIKRRVPFTRMFIAISKRPIFFEHDELKFIAKRKFKL